MLRFITVYFISTYTQYTLVHKHNIMHAQACTINFNDEEDDWRILKCDFARIALIASIMTFIVQDNN